MIDRSRSSAADRRLALFALYGMTIGVVLLQRLAVPLGGAPISVTLLVVLIGFVFLLLSGSLVEDRVRMGLYLVAISVCLVSAMASFVWREGPSFTSVLLLVVLYAPFTYVLRPALADLFPRVIEFFCKLMMLGAVVAIAQWLAQLGGWQFTDYPERFLPEQFLVPDYNTSYPLRYGSDLWKSNGLFFLEPSFCSQFLALAIIAQLVQGGKRWRIPLYAFGLLTTVSGTGLVLLGFGLAVLAWRRGAIWSLGILGTTVIAMIAVAVTPMGKIFVERAAEARDPDSSVSLRFNDPYIRAFHNLGEKPSAPLIGYGPGFVEQEAEAHLQRTQLQLAFPVIPKLAAEYGIAAAILFTAFLVTAFGARTPSATLAACLLFMHFTLSGSLLQPQTVYLALILASLFATIVPIRRYDPVPAPTLTPQPAAT
jgi:hypothetical protein